MSDWIRVKPHRPCPICGKPDWCEYTADGLIYCMRVPSNRPVRNGGWLHRRRPGFRPIPPPRKSSNSNSNGGPEIDWDKLHSECLAGTDPRGVRGLAQELGVDDASLEVLGAAWAGEHHAWAFPMRDAANRMIGMRLRNSNGRKWAVRGSGQGLFIPQVPAADSALWLCEGPTDTAAALSLGLYAVGRPSCSACVGMTLALVQRRHFSRVVIVADSDGPGLAGADKLAESLTVPYIVWIPPAKDLREFVRGGGDYDVIQSALKDLQWSRP